MIEDWRREALLHIPACWQTVEEANDLGELWSELYLEFAAAYNRANILGESISHAPEDEAIIRQIYDYAEWCLLRSEGQDALTYAIVDFYECLGINLYARREIPQYMGPEAFGALRQAKVFEYFVSPDEYGEFIEAYQEHNQPEAAKGRSRRKQRKATA